MEKIFLLILLFFTASCSNWNNQGTVYRTNWVLPIGCSYKDGGNNILVVYTKFPIEKLTVETNWHLNIVDPSMCSIWYTNYRSYAGIVSNTNYLTVVGYSNLARVIFNGLSSITNNIFHFSGDSDKILFSANDVYALVQNNKRYFSVYTNGSFSEDVSTEKWLYLKHGKSDEALIFDKNLILTNFKTGSSQKIVLNCVGMIGFSPKNRYIFYTSGMSATRMLTTYDYRINFSLGQPVIYDTVSGTNIRLVDYTPVSNAHNPNLTQVETYLYIRTNYLVFTNEYLYITKIYSNAGYYVKSTSWALWHYGLTNNDTPGPTNDDNLATVDYPIGFTYDLKYIYFIVNIAPLILDYDVKMWDGKKVRDVTGIYRMDISSLNLTE